MRRGAGFFRDDALPRPCASPARRSGATSLRWSRPASPTISAISNRPAHRQLRRLACPGRDFRQCAGDAQGARPDPRLCPHRASCRHVRGSAPLGPATARRSRAADRLFVVSRVWREWLAARVRSRGASRRQWRRYASGSRQRRDATDAALRARLEPAAGTPVFLAVGGVEERKNTIGMLEAFRTSMRRHPSCAPGDRRRRLAARPRCLSGSDLPPLLRAAACRTRP